MGEMAEMSEGTAGEGAGGVRAGGESPPVLAAAEDRREAPVGAPGLSRTPARAGGLGRRAAGLALAGALLLGTVGGGAAGSAATLYWLGRTAPPATPVAAPAEVKPATAPTSPQLMATSAAAGLAPEGAVASIYSEVSPAVVTVVVRQTSGPRAGVPPASGEGSGFVVDAEGRILTNYHVVEGASEIMVKLVDGTALPAKVVGAAPDSDLALLQAAIPAEKLTVAKLGDSNRVRPGDLAIAIGSPFGLDHSVTAGIVSGVGRAFGTAAGRPMRNLLQTDTPINPGNSGGPILNQKGEVIGIATSIESPVRGSVGVGFAIPINAAKQLLPRLATGQQVQHPWLGISGVALTPQIALSLGLAVKSGVLVAEVVPGGPAAQAGLRGATRAAGDLPAGGDVIVALDQRPVQSVEDIGSYLEGKAVGESVALTVLRDGKPVELTATLAPWPASRPS